MHSTGIRGMSNRRKFRQMEDPEEVVEYNLLPDPVRSMLASPVEKFPPPMPGCILRAGTEAGKAVYAAPRGTTVVAALAGLQDTRPTLAGERAPVRIGDLEGDQRLLAASWRIMTASVSWPDDLSPGIRVVSTFKTPRRRRRDAKRRQAQEARWAARRPQAELTSDPEPDSQAAVER